MPPRRQPDLFSDAPAVPTARDLRIVAQGRAPLTREQQSFNRLLQQVEKLRDQLATWTEFEFRHRQLVAEKLLPLLGELMSARRNLIAQCSEILEGRLGGGVRTATERRQLQAFLLELCEAHLEESGGDDEIVAIYDRHAPRSFAERRAEEQRALRDAVEEVFGIDLGDRPNLDGETIFEAITGEAEPDGDVASERSASTANRRQSAKARQRESERAAAAEQAAREMSQSVREVYRKLASALHPDRGADEAERQRRHHLMQRVNDAYESSNLLDLLTLQLQIEQIDEDHLATVSASRLRHYNQILRDQAKELKQELASITDHFRLVMSKPSGRPTPRSLERDLELAVVEARRDVTELREHAEALLDPRYRRDWLREYTRESRDELRTLQEIELEIDALFGLGGGAAGFDRPGGTRRKSGRKGRRKRKQR